MSVQYDASCTGTWEDTLLGMQNPLPWCYTESRLDVALTRQFLLGKIGFNLPPSVINIV